MVPGLLLLGPVAHFLNEAWDVLVPWFLGLLF